MSGKDGSLPSFPDAFPFLVALATEGCALCLLTFTSIASRHTNVVCVAFALLIKGAICNLALNLGRLCRAATVGCILKAVRALPEAVTEGIPGMFGMAALYLNIILAAAAVLVIDTGQNGTIQIGH